MIDEALDEDLRNLVLVEPLDPDFDEPIELGDLLPPTRELLH